jgi:NAD(P)H-hydrate epimerase
LPRPAAAHKGIFGRVLVVAGGVGMGGAGLLAAEAALRAGAGAVTLATAPDHVAPALARCPELMVRGVTHRRDLAPLLARADAVLLRPGLGLDGWARQLFGAVLEARLPTVFDADGLTLLAESGPRVLPFPALLTPHPGEAGRLLGCPTAAVESDRFAAAEALAKGYGAPTVLKGAGAIIASDAGLAVSLGGNSAMATAGMGDVLAGLTVGLWAQGLAGEAALTAAVQLHGEAGDRAAEHRGPSLLARDLFDEVGPLLKAWGQ